MKALSLWEPWATLVRRGLKLYETRDWPMPAALIDQPLAIQAARHPVRADDMSAVMQRQLRLDDVSGPWAYGCFVCVVYPQKSVRAGELVRVDEHGLILPGELGNDRPISFREYAYGNYEAVDADSGRPRWGWPFQDIRVLPEPIPYRGAQGIFNWPEGDAIYPDLW